MEDRESSRSPANWIGLAFLITAAVGSIWWYQSPLKSSRPAEDDLPGVAIFRDKDRLVARLWEDPFEVVMRKEHRARWETATQDEDPLDIKSNSVEPMLVLPVMVTSTSFGDGVEWRIRTRVAVLSGLAAAGYAPVNGESIGCLPIDPTETRQRMQSTSQRREQSRMPDILKLPVPFEWFQPSHTASAAASAAGKPGPLFQRILVVWWGEDWFAAAPLHNQASVRKQLIDTCPKSELLRDKAKYRIIGPFSSAMLRAMFDELNPADKVHLPIAGAEVTFFSATATSDDAQIYHGLTTERIDPTAPPRSLMARLCNEASFNFRNLVCTDVQLAHEVLLELGRRGIDPHRGDRIALVAEHDTFYGRSLPYAFVKAADLPELEGTSPSLGDPKRAVRCFTYLRGLDGKLADTDGKASGNRSVSVQQLASDRQPQARDLEHPEGNSQLDYIPRLAEELRRWGQDRKLRAIGVLGSDVYDKLLLLQALRSRFPEVQFFTTDLDARLFHPQELNWTRNLIVASSYGLQLAPELQRDIPPFRDSYQTALFRAVLEAVDDPPAKKRLAGVSAPPPRLFEIGYSGAHDLSTESDEPIHPPRPLEPWYLVVLRELAHIVIFLALFGVAICSLMPLPYSDWNRLRAHWPWLLALFAVLLGYGCIVVYCHNCRAGMPFSWSEGISIWPTEILRLAAAVLGAYLLFYCSSRLAESESAASHMLMIDFSPASRGQASANSGVVVPNSVTNSTESPAGSASERSSRRGRLTRLGLWLSTMWKRRGEHCIAKWREKNDTNSKHADTETLDGAKLWREYCERGLPIYRWLRCIPAAAAYALAVVGIMRLFDLPSQPHRGPFSLGANMFVLVLSVVVFILVTAYVIDAIRLCTRFINIVVHKPTKWPDDLLKEWEGRLGLDRSYLDEWLDMRLIAKLTEAVGQLIWWPLLLLALLAIARNPFFANFDWPISLWLVFGLNTAFVVGYAVLLRRAAREARDVELQRLRLKAIKAEKEEKGTAEQIRQLVKEIEGMTGGAFAPLSADPIVHAVLVSVSGICFPAIITYLNVAHW